MIGVLLRTVRIDKDTEGRPCDDKGRSQGERPHNETNLGHLDLGLLATRLGGNNTSVA